MHIKICSVLICYLSTISASKTLVIITGSVRGSDIAHRSLERHLLEPYCADLLLCTGKSKDHSPYLYKLATYLEEYPQADDWRMVADTVSKELFGHTRWRNYSQKLAGSSLTGIYDSQNRWTGRGSGLLILASRYYAWKWLERSGLLDHYNYFVISRSDYYYLADHPSLSALLSENNHIAVPFIHEDYWGICDRHAVVDRVGLEAYLGAFKLFLEFHPEYGPYPNNESVLWATLYKFYQFVPLRYQLPAYMVRADDDKTTTWAPGNTQDSNGLWIKQYGEYEEAQDYLSKVQ